MKQFLLRQLDQLIAQMKAMREHIAAAAEDRLLLLKTAEMVLSLDRLGPYLHQYAFLHAMDLHQPPPSHCGPWWSPPPLIVHPQTAMYQPSPQQLYPYSHHREN